MRVMSVSFVFHLALKKAGMRPQMPPAMMLAANMVTIEQPAGQDVAQDYHAGRGGEAAGHYLALAADVPEAAS